MVLSRWLLRIVLAIACFSLAVFSYSGINGTVDISNKETNSSYLNASPQNNRLLLNEEPEETLITLEVDSDPCDKVTCINIYPEDGKIDGKTVSQMTPTGINSLGQVVGTCTLEGSSDPFAFVREPDGNVWIFRTPSVSGQGEFTDINDSGAAVGFYENDSVRTKIGFVMDSSRKWIEDIEYPENRCPEGRSYLHTQPNGINGNGEIVGNFGCTARPEDSAETLFNGDGFYRSPDGTFYRVQYENAVRTVAGKISDAGVIIGYYVQDNNVWVPFAAVKEEVIHPIGESESRIR